MLKYAVRQLLKAPGFSVVAIIMLALGIGMSASVFSVVKSVLLSSMPFADSERLVRIYSTSAESQMLPHSPGNFLDIRNAATSFSGIAGFIPQNANVAEPGKAPEQVFGLSATANFLTTLGLQPFLGRGFAPDEDQPGKGTVMLLTDRYWRQKFAADPKILGRRLRVGTDTLTVVGILPPSFDKTIVWYGCAFVSATTFWPNYASERSGKWFSMFGRLKPGVDLQSAQAELATVASRLDRDYPVQNGLDGLRIVGLNASWVGASTRKLDWMIVSLGALVLVIACSNLASVQLARAFGRSHEFAVRSALGAGRLALMGPLIVESVLITLVGACGGMLLANWSNHLIRHHFLNWVEITIDLRVILFALVGSLVTALIFGMAPAWLASRVSTGDALKETSRGSTSSRSHRWFKLALIVGQLALATVLVSAALSFSIGVKKFLRRDLGWQPQGLFSAILDVPFEKDDGKKTVFNRTLLEKLGQIPGVEKASLTSSVPLYGYQNQKKIIVEGDAPLPAGQEPIAFVTAVDQGFFDTLRIPLREGRSLPLFFKVGDPDFIVINESMARRYWPGKSPMGKRVKFTDRPGWNEVIGVVGDVSMATTFDNPATRMQIYCGLQRETGIWYNVVLKSSLPPDVLQKPLQKAIADINPDIMVQEAGGVPQVLENMLAGNNLIIVTLGAFAAVGILIAMIGLYGVISQLTVQRRREVGIRMALGADYFAIVRLILTQGVLLIMGGVVAGLAGAFGVNAIFRQTMPGMVLPGWELQIAITALLGGAGLSACYFPARRAGRANPVSALRAT